MVSATIETLYLYFARYYLWIDDKSKKSRVSSPQYVDFVMTFVQKTVNDETLFPTKEIEYNTTNYAMHCPWNLKNTWGGGVEFWTYGIPQFF